MAIRTEPINTLFDAERMTYQETIDTSIASLNAYATKYPHWLLAYSGGKDSSATVSFVQWAINNGHVPRPQTLNVIYCDTGMELPPLHATAMKLLDQLKADGWNVKIAAPELDRRFWVYMLGRGVPPPKQGMRWCTARLKAEPMAAAVKELESALGGKVLSITGVRQGESAARDNRIAISCSKNGGECGQGWFQKASRR